MKYISKEFLVVVLGVILGYAIFQSHLLRTSDRIIANQDIIIDNFFVSFDDLALRYKNYRKQVKAQVEAQKPLK